MSRGIPACFYCTVRAIIVDDRTCGFSTPAAQASHKKHKRRLAPPDV